MIYIFSGDNDYLINYEVNKLVKDLMTSKEYFDIEKLDGEGLTPSQLRENLNTYSFLSPRRIVIIEDIDKIKNIADDIKETLNNLDESVELIIKAKAIDKRSSLYLFLKKQKNFKELKKLSVMDLSKWANSYLSENNAKISSTDLNYLISRVGDDQLNIKNELDKLMLIGKEIKKTDIDNLTEQSINSKIFDLLNCAFEGNKKKTMDIYSQQRFLKVEPEVILSMISWQLTNLAFIIFGKNLSQSDLAEISGLSPYTIANTKRLVRNLNSAKLTKLISELSEIDYKSKTSSFNLDEALKNYLLTIS